VRSSEFSSRIANKNSSNHIILWSDKLNKNQEGGRRRSLPDDEEHAPDSMSEERFLKQLQSTIPGIPGVDYPLYQSVPETSFKCQNQRNPGFYGDVEAQCQVFHICQEDDRHDSFLCPVGTVFNQMNFICDWWFNFKCDDTPTFFHLNAQYYTSTGVTPGSVMIQETMKKMRNFRGVRRPKPSIMKISMRTMHSDLNDARNMMSMDNLRKMAEMERRRIMNLFSPKMRPHYSLKRLRAITNKNNGGDDTAVHISSTSAASPARNEEFKSLASTDYLGFYMNPEYLTTSVVPTGVTHELLSTSQSPSPTFESNDHTELQNNTDTTTEFENISTTTQDQINVTDHIPLQNHTSDVLLSESTPNAAYKFNEVNSKNAESSTMSAKMTSFDDDVDGGINIWLTIPSTTVILDNDTTSGSQEYASEGSLNDLLSLINLNMLNSTEDLRSLTEQNLEDHIDFFRMNDSQNENELRESPPVNEETPTPLSVLHPNSDISFSFKPGVSNNSVATIGNGTHVSVSVTIRATAGISRLKWRRVPHGKKRKNLRLKNAPPERLNNTRSSLMDEIIFRKRPMKSKKLRSRIMWIPTKNNTLNRKSQWKIFLSSRPQSEKSYNDREGREQMQKAELTSNTIIPIRVQDMEVENKNENLDVFQTEIPLPSQTDSMSEALMTESTKIDFNLMAASEPTIHNSSFVSELRIRSEMIAGIVNDTESLQLKSHENVTDSGETIDCATLCIKLLKSLATENYSTDETETTATMTVFETSPISTEDIHFTNSTEENYFGRRSYLGVSPSDQWTVKYDPGPNCDEDQDDDKVLVRGWSVIIDSGSVTKEKTVKRRTCKNKFDDSKMIVMQRLLPDHQITPNEKEPNNRFHKTTNEPKISFGSMDQQYWLTLVKNWLEASPNSNPRSVDGRDDSVNNWNRDKNKAQDQKEDFRSWSSDQRVKGNYNRIQSTKGRHFQGQKSDLAHSSANKNTDVMNSDKGWSADGNRKREWQTKNKPKVKSTKTNYRGSSSQKRFLETGAKQNGNSDWQYDVWSSQSDRKEWHIDIARKNQNDNDFGNNFNSGRRDLSFNGNDRINFRPDDITRNSASPPKNNDNTFRPRSGTQGWFSEYIKSLSEEDDWSDRQNSQTRPKKKTKRDQDEWFMSSEESRKISQPQKNTRSWGDDKSDWDSMDKRNLKKAEEMKGFPIDQRNPNPWSSDSSNKWASDMPNTPWSVDTLKKPRSSDIPNKLWSSDTSNKPWSSDAPNKPWSSDTVDRPWSSGPSKDPWSSTKAQSDDNIDSSKKDWSSGSNRGIKGGDSRKSYPDTKTKPDWSSKNPDFQDNRQSTKGGRRDNRGSFDKSDESIRRNPQDWSYDDRSNIRPPFPSPNNKDTWIKDEQSTDWNTGSRDDQDDRSSSGRRNKNVWASDDQQTKADWSDSKVDSSYGNGAGSKKSKPFPQSSSRDSPDTSWKQKGDPSQSNRKGNSWPAQHDKNKWMQDMQKDISDWSMDDSQSKTDWSSKNRNEEPTWGSGPPRARDDKPSQPKTPQRGWSEDKPKDGDSYTGMSVDSKKQWNKDGRSVENRRGRSDESDLQNKWTYDDQKDISDDNRNLNGWPADSRKGTARGISGSNTDWSKGGPSDWSSNSRGDMSNQRPGAFKGSSKNHPSSSKGQTKWSNDDSQSQPRQWKEDSPKAPSDWSPNSKGMSTKNKEQRPQNDWATDNNPPMQMEENWSWDFDTKPDSITKGNPKPGASSPRTDSWNNDEDWPNDNVWSAEPKQNPQKGSDSTWDQNSKGMKTNVKGQTATGSWNTKGITKTAMVMPSISKGSTRMTPKKPWKDESDEIKPTKNVKGAPEMKEEKIVWSIQISSNGKPENGWVPITLRPNIKNRANQTRNEKGSSMDDGGWSGLKQEMDSWASKGLGKGTAPPQFKADMVTESISPSTHMLDASDSHPFYIPIISRRYKRNARPVPRIKYELRSNEDFRRVFKVIKNGRELKNSRNGDNRFYVASADILVGDSYLTKKGSTNFKDDQKTTKSVSVGKRQYNETIKNSVPSLIQIKNKRFKNSSSNDENKFPSNVVWDSMMQESEAKESWSAPFDDSNVPASGWIPLFRVVKVPRNNSPIPNTNATRLEETVFKERTTNKSDSTVYSDPESKHVHTNYSAAPNKTNITMELPEPEFENFPHENITTDFERSENGQHIQQEMKVGNKTLRIIPFSDIMKQLRVRPTESNPMESTTSMEGSTSFGNEWNIPITASPKTYALKLVNNSEMQNQNLSNSWTFSKRIPKGHEAWILVKGSEGENKTMASENKDSTSVPKSAERSNIPYKIIVGNRTRESEEITSTNENKSIAVSNSRTPTTRPSAKEFSLNLKDWHKESGWTPLIRAVGSVTSTKINQTSNGNTGGG
ncbi:uncharacterized protein TNCT_418731, partial [Trichonephila clavata]